MNELVIFGMGGHAREIAQLVADINQAQPGRWNLLGFVVDPQATTQIVKPLPAPLLGDAQWLTQHPSTQTVIAAGIPVVRRDIALRLAKTHPTLRYSTLVHPRAWLAQRVQLGEGSVVFAGSLINVDVTIGQHASIGLGCTISHDCVLDDYVSLGPGVHLGGGCHIDSEADLGVGVSVRPAAHIGAACIVGAGACVIADLPPTVTAVGIPAKFAPIGKPRTRFDEPCSPS